MAKIRVANWGRFQHYKNRNPPWIKMHRALLDNREWHALSGDASKLLAECWLLASEYDEGAIPMDARDLAWRLRRNDAARVLDLLQELAERGFLLLEGEVGGDLLARRERPATPEAEAERETDTETNANALGAGGADEDDGDVIDADVEVIEPGEDEPRPVPANVIPIRSREEQPAHVGADDIVAEWIRRQPERPPASTIRKQGAVAKRLAEGCTRRDLQMAFVGIEQLFPYSNGEPWDLFDLERKLAKAKAAAVNHPRMREARMEAELDAALDALDLGGAA